MITRIIEVMHVPGLRKKIFFTLGLLLVYQLGFHIYLPGVNTEVVRRLAEGQGFTAAFGILNALFGSAIGSCTLFSLGLMPYISAWIIFSLLAKMVPSLEQLAKEGAQRQRKINQYTRYATVPICFIQAFIVMQGMIGQEIASAPAGHALIDPELFSNFFYRMGVVMMLTTGTLFIMWLGEKISEHGIGNGISLIIMAGILSRVPALLVYSFSADPEGRTQALTMIAILFIIVVGVIVFVTKAQRRIPIQQAKLTRGRRQLGGVRHYIPLKLNSAGVMPIVFASALFIIPNLLGQIPWLGWMNEYLGYGGGAGSYFYLLAYPALIFFFSFFWTALMFQPNEIANNLKEHGSFVPGIRPGKRTADYLEAVMVRVTLAGATFLAALAMFPQFAGRMISGVDIGLVYVIGGTNILIVVGVCLDLVDKINAHLVMRNYEGFMGGGGSEGGASSWARRRR